jgi:predicted site-specific integrase-resolvase
MSGELLPLIVVARRAHRHPGTLRKWLAEGKIEAVKVGSEWIFTEEQAAAVPPRKVKS